MHNLTDPAILFFVFGVLAGMLRSNLEIPQAISKFLSLYLLMALGLKGGFALARSGLSPEILLSLGTAVGLAFMIPSLGYLFLRRHVAGFDAAAVAAAYGSVSAVTFVTAMQHLENNGMTFGGHMAVAMVLMESPAIIMAVLLASTLRHTHSAASATAPAAARSVVHMGGAAALTPGGAGSSMFSGMGGRPQGNASEPGAGPGRGLGLGRILHESFTDGAHLLLLGAMAVGFISGDAGKAMMQPFSGDLFKGMLAFFLLDMGLMVARHFGEARKASPVLLGYAVVGPVLHAALALGLAWMLGLPAADGALLMVLSASASYIVVPAVLRYAIPEANPALYFGLSLGVTFPINILAGIPLYTAAALALL